MKNVLCVLISLFILFPSCARGDETDNGASSKEPLDLAALSDSLAYARLVKITRDADLYVGQAICIKGLYDNVYDESLGRFYHFVLLYDATACCYTGIEFLLPETNTYPVSGESIIVEGAIESYLENDDTYYQIVAESLEII